MDQRNRSQDTRVTLDLRAVYNSLLNPPRYEDIFVLALLFLMCICFDSSLMLLLTLLDTNKSDASLLFHLKISGIFGFCTFLLWISYIVVVSKYYPYPVQDYYFFLSFHYKFMILAISSVTQHTIGITFAALSVNEIFSIERIQFTKPRIKSPKSGSNEIYTYRFLSIVNLTSQSLFLTYSCMLLIYVIYKLHIIRFRSRIKKEMIPKELYQNPDDLEIIQSPQINQYFS